MRTSSPTSPLLSPGENFEHDPSIKINIRTPTSTRAEQKSTVLNSPSPNIVNAVNASPPHNRRARHNSPQITLFVEFYPVNGLNNNRSLRTSSLRGGRSNRNIRRMIEQIINESLAGASEIKRNPDVTLDIEKHIYNNTIDKGVCVVCQSEYAEDDILSTLSCSHTFHNNCIGEWGKYNSACPVCRKEIPISSL